MEALTLLLDVAAMFMLAVWSFRIDRKDTPSNHASPKVGQRRVP